MIWTCSQAEKQVLGYAIRGREGKIQGHIGGFHLKSRRRFCHCELGKQQRMWEEETFWSVEGVETGQEECKIQERQRESWRLRAVPEMWVLHLFGDPSSGKTLHYPLSSQIRLPPLCQGDIWTACPEAKEKPPCKRPPSVVQRVSVACFKDQDLVSKTWWCMCQPAPGSGRTLRSSEETRG